MKLSDWITTLDKSFLDKSFLDKSFGFTLEVLSINLYDETSLQESFALPMNQ